MQIALCKQLAGFSNKLAGLLVTGTLCLASMPSVAEISNQERQAELQNMLVQDCGSCHGLSFRGGSGPPLLPENLEGKPREYLIATILNGRPETAMPPWHPLMTREEAEWMLDQLLSTR